MRRAPGLVKFVPCRALLCPQHSRNLGLLFSRKLYIPDAASEVVLEADLAAALRLRRQRDAHAVLLGDKVWRRQSRLSVRRLEETIFKLGAKIKRQCGGKFKFQTW